ncbi:hypothetical protein E1301_Tti001863 [Triplophysa tibetana]|uniref:Uncharacterized protein n=1 Tax=Triplophysa tibetana TaxID=1572043 RepID=A0A5A9PK69_9TELE|nr:hypothetical protein E1301_Tti001863 [Triplophysa tibetana]
MVIDGVQTRISSSYDHINLPPTSLTSLYKPVIFRSCRNDTSRKDRTAHRSGPRREGPDYAVNIRARLSGKTQVISLELYRAAGGLRGRGGGIGCQLIASLRGDYALIEKTTDNYGSQDGSARERLPNRHGGRVGPGLIITTETDPPPSPQKPF